MSRKFVIQISRDDVKDFERAANLFVRYRAYFGEDIEVIAVSLGPGLGFSTIKSEFAEQIKEILSNEKNTILACQNTMDKIKKKTGQYPKLLDGIDIAEEGGHIRIQLLRDKGYSYVVP